MNRFVAQVSLKEVRLSVSNLIGIQCKDRAISKKNPFCLNHQQLKLIPEKSTVLTEGNICMAKTSKGKPCKSKRDPESQYCRDHKNKFSTIEVVSISENEDQDDHLSLATSEEPIRRAMPMMDSAAFLGAPCADDEPKSSSSFADTEQEELPSIGSGIDLESKHDSDSEADDNYEHLKEVFECKEIDDMMKEDGYRDYIPEPVLNEDDGFSDLTLPSAWGWDMSHSLRLHVVRGFVNYAISLYPNFFQVLEAEFKKKQIEYHTAVTESRSAVYEGKSVIAGTIVGCISRLDIIRGTNPFAIVVEEASEVLEPILFSCIGSSTIKLEMIGDHLQLQPCMSAKFEFEKINKIKCSLFERLIRAPEDCRVPYNVLSIQRRMRKEISDFTRSFYSHITEIKDDSLVKTRCIGQGLKTSRCGLRSPKKVFCGFIKG
jgi:hypothetical protein